MSEMIPIEKVQPNENQPRQHFEGIEELAENIKQHGLLTPILVRPIMSRDIFEIVHGERRYRACKLLGMEKIRAEVRELDDQAAFTASLIENVQRSNLTPLEEAKAFQRILDQDFTQDELGDQIGKSQSYISHKLRTLRLPPGVKHYLRVGALTEGHARQLMRIEKLYPEGVPGRKTIEVSSNDFTADIIGEHDYILEEMRKDRDDLIEPFSYLSALGEAYPDELYAFLGLHLISCSPEYLPPFDVLLSYEGIQNDNLMIVLEAAVEFLNGSEGDIPQWVTAAHWFASCAYLSNASVSLLKDMIDGWYERYQAAVFYKNNMGKKSFEKLKKQIEKENPETDADYADIIYDFEADRKIETIPARGYFLDLLYSRSLMLDHYDIDATVKIARSGGYALPSSLQEYTRGGREFLNKQRNQ